MEIKEKAKEYLTEHPKVPQVFATTDGFLFLRKDNAKAHANTLTDKKVEEFKQEPKKDEQPFDILHGDLKYITSEIEKTEDKGFLEALLDQEENGANRTEVLNLIINRIDEIKK